MRPCSHGAAQLSGRVTDEDAIKPQVESQTPGAARGAPADGNIALKNECAKEKSSQKMQKLKRRSGSRRWERRRIAGGGERRREHPAEQRGLNTAITRTSARPLSGAPVRSTDEQVRVCAPGCVGDVRAHTWESEKERARAH